MVVAMNQPREDLRRLASYVVDARIEAGFPTRKEFAAATGVTARTLGKLETASERVSNDTLARVARELHWTPDSPARVMGGGEPVRLKDPAPRDPLAPAPELAGEPEGDAAAARYPGDKSAQDIWRLDEREEIRLGLIAELYEMREQLWRSVQEGGPPSLRRNNPANSA
jgi:transcriptional regulator with XRE-family HTH domain